MTGSLHHQQPIVTNPNPFLWVRMRVWWGTPVECTSALQRLIRGGLLPAGAGGLGAATARLRELEKSWAEIEATQPVKQLKLIGSGAQRAVEVDA